GPGAGGVEGAGPEGPAGVTQCRAEGTRPGPPANRTARERAGENEAGVGDHGKSTRALRDALRERGLRDQAEAVIDEALVELEPLVSTKVACRLVGQS